MTLNPNTLISHYKILSPIGKGGMGEVYRALDERLDREVAIKMLPEEFARDKDRLARFEQEAKATSALNHPHILTVYDIGEHDGSPFLVAELLEGEELRDRLETGSIPEKKVIAYASQITSGLSAAHEKGIVHRDLKPENIFITSDERVKILDFGIAKLTEKEPVQSEDATRKALTDPGMVLGTAAYMSPEQVRGETVDHRSDIFSFGSILYEMLFGQSAFRKETMAETMTAILKEEPDSIHVTNSAANPALTRILERCLEKRPENRFQSATDLRFALEAIPETSGQLPTRSYEAVDTLPTTFRSGRKLWPILAIVSLVLFLGALMLAFYFRSNPSEQERVVTFDVLAPNQAYPNIQRWPTVALSPDGKKLVFVAIEGSVNYLYLRDLESAEVTRIEGSRDASIPVFSPDGKTIAFQADYQLKRVTPGEPVVTIAPGRDVRSLSWKDNSTIIFSPEATSPLFEIPITGGEAKPVTTLNKSKKERTHRLAQTLPGGKAMIFTVGLLDNPDNYEDATIEALVFSTGQRVEVMKGASMARYSPTGHLIFARGGVLYAIKFDPDSLKVSGEPVAVLQGVAGDRAYGNAQYSISENGTLAFIPGAVGKNIFRLVPAWVDPKEGDSSSIPMTPGFYNDIRLSPDAKKLAYLIGSSGSGDVWIYDLEKNTSTRLTFDNVNAAPVWSADGRYVYYTRIQSADPRTSIMRKPADGSSEGEKICTIDRVSYLKSISEDGASAIIDHRAESPFTDVARIRLEANAKPELLVTSDFNEEEAAISNNGRWLAYTSNETGRPEVYVKDLSGTGARFQVSSSEGFEPNWSNDDRTLFFRSTGAMMAAYVTFSPTFSAGSPRELFKIDFQIRSNTGISYDVSPVDGRLIRLIPADSSSAPLAVRIVLNWDNELRRILSEGKTGN